MKTKQSFGGGYGINRGLKAASHLPTAIPAHGSVTIKPGGGYSRSATGHSGKKHFSGAKLESDKD